jgi:hypothetical protein
MDLQAHLENIMAPNDVLDMIRETATVIRGGRPVETLTPQSCIDELDQYMVSLHLNHRLSNNQIHCWHQQNAH